MTRAGLFPVLTKSAGPSLSAGRDHDRGHDRGRDRDRARGATRNILSGRQC